MIATIVNKVTASLSDKAKLPLFILSRQWEVFTITLGECVYANRLRLNYDAQVVTLISVVIENEITCCGE